jgi:hypothetical protein
LEPEYQRNPIEAAARFECNPPKAQDAFFRDQERLLAGFSALYDINGKPVENKDLFPLDEFGRFKSWFRKKGNDNWTRYISVDLGLKRDRAALAMCHSPGLRKIQVSDGIYERLPVIKMDIIHYWEAEPGQEIDFSGIREFIFALARRFDIGLVSFDRWNSADMIQAVQRKNIKAQMHSVGLADYDNLMTCIYDGRFIGYYHELLLDELMRLQLINGKKVDHPPNGSKDLADALAGAVWLASSYSASETEIEATIIGGEESIERDMMLEEIEDFEGESIEFTYF